ncbi:sulfite exporter TauE/SafE [bacterium BMS3Abin02]|nr:sulfite exporter TauE/SafE [bacterium BMS3Abin02]GBE21797.1 sulfite exporter TauE/SafE [bacterium BMS3Bbin01]HDH26868.1 sulfite exporter TauE/SafE family protein [Actinomycetota bacterium]
MIIAIAAAAFLIGFSKAGVGGILGPFVTVLVALTIPADDAIGLLLPMLIIADVFTIAVHWRGWDRPILLRLLAPAAIGIVAGGIVVSNVSEPMLRRIIALTMLVFVVFYVLNSKPGFAAKLARRHAWPVGLIAGLSSTIAHLGAPPVVTYLMTTDLKPRRFVATSAAVFAGMNLLKLPAYLFAGLFDGGLIAATWWTWLAIPVGVAGGRVFVGHINRLWFDRMTLGLLVGGALILLVT